MVMLIKTPSLPLRKATANRTYKRKEERCRKSDMRCVWIQAIALVADAGLPL